MLTTYVHHALNLYDKADAVLICDKSGYVEYGKWNDGSFFRPSEVVGMHILELYPTLDEESSTILKVLKTGQPLYNSEQEIPNFKGQMVHILSTTMPVTANGEIVGAMCASYYWEKACVQKNKSTGQSRTLYSLDDIITSHPAMMEVKEKIKKISINNSTVLIHGETGTGKELISQSIHTSSYRCEQPFVSQNCAAIPVNLLEGIFFGTEKGSYTGAESRKGLFELADGGTLFLDEINSMDISMQAKLLKAIEEKKIRRLGGYKDINFDVRIICAMNENPIEAIKNGRLREDLYYRISVVQIISPPLRERKSDIMLLTDNFIKQYNKDMNMNIEGLSEIAKAYFETYEWKGNVRELKNMIESAFNTAKGKIITMQDLPVIISSSERIKININHLSLRDALEKYEKDLIMEAIKQNANVTEAAKTLKISRQSLQYKLEKYGIR